MSIFLILLFVGFALVGIGILQIASTSQSDHYSSTGTFFGGSMQRRVLKREEKK